MTIWSTIQSFFEAHGIISEIGTATRVVGFYNIMAIMMLGLLLLVAGIVARQTKFQPSWLAPASVGVFGLSALVLPFVPGFPLMSLLGLVLGPIAIVIAVLLHNKRIQGEMNNMVPIGVGIFMAAASIIMLVSEIVYGGGFLG